MSDQLKPRPVSFTTKGLEEVSEHLHFKPKGGKTNLNVHHMLNKITNRAAKQNWEVGKKNACQFQGTFEVNKLKGMVCLHRVLNAHGNT